MPKVISFANMKGGVGKTTLVVNLAFELFFNKKRVLIIDNDPQFNATSSLISHKSYIQKVINSGSLKTIYDIYEKAPKIHGKTVPPSSNPKDFINTIWRYQKTDITLDIIPSRIELYETLKNPTQKEYLLNKFIKKHLQNYDYIFIDCPPTPSVLTVSALAASDFVIIPVIPGFFSTIGIPQFLAFVDEFKSDQHDDHNVKILGVVINAMDRKRNPDAIKAISQVEAALIENGTDVGIFNQRISKFKIYEKSLWQAKPTRMVKGRGTAQKSLAALELLKLADEIVKKINILEGNNGQDQH